ncbi:MAG TPA: hypothetical protein VGR88_06905 [Ktedonobacterales bacterium]|nr:hypothetical protein [Ktedonobacterales bacterium]
MYAAVHINITKGAAHQPFSLLSLLGGLFALISLGVFVLTMPRRAAVPQPVGRRQ